MKTEHNKPRIRRQLCVLLAKIVILAAVFWLLFFRIFGVHRISDDSLEPALKDGDLAVTWELGENTSPAGTEGVDPDRVVFLFRPRSISQAGR